MQTTTPSPATPLTFQAATTQSPMPTSTGETIAVRIAHAAHAGNDTLSVELHPAELGDVTVRLEYHDGGTVSVQMVVNRPETYQAFLHDRAGLEQQFAQAGIDLGNSGLDLRFGQSSGESSGQSPDNSRFGSQSSTQQPETAVQPTRTLLTSGSGLLDIMA